MSEDEGQNGDFDVVGSAELRELLGVSRSRADSISREKGFPDPVINEPRYRAWRRRDVYAWLDAHREGWRDA